MKNLFFLVFFCLIKIQITQAQATDRWGDVLLKGNNEVNLSVGALSNYEIDEYQHSSPKANYFIYDINVSRTVFFTYKHFFAQTAAFGITAGFQTGKGDLVEYVSGNTGHIKYGYFNAKTYTVAPEITLVYTSKPNHRFYGYFGLGITYIEPTYDFDKTIGDATTMYPNLISKTGVAFQLTPLAWSWGNKVAFCLELGYGYKGIFNIGLSYRW